jgi:hypothetical protein
MKVASAEYKGLMSYFDCHIDGLLTPLMAVMDYVSISSSSTHILQRGWRVSAVALLDINNETLVYGKNPFIIYSDIMKVVQIKEEMLWQKIL